MTLSDLNGETGSGPKIRDHASGETITREELRVYATSHTKLKQQEGHTSVLSALAPFRGELEFIRHPTEFGNRPGLHLSHQMAAMHLHGRLGDAQIAGDLLAKPALVDLNHDLALACSQSCETLPDRSQGFFTLTPGAIAREADLDGIKEILIAIRLREELNSAPLHRLHRHRDIAVPGDKDDWKFLLRRRELALKVETTSPRQSHVEHQAGRTIHRIGFEKFGNGPE